jgi:gamma-glutamyltranspeptidase
VLLNNRMNGFALERGHPNMIAPGKRPAHTLCPCLVFDEAGLRYLVSSPGGRGQTITLAQAITNLIDRRATLSDTVRMPRWSSDRAGAVILEDEFPDEVLDALASAGIDAGRNVNNGPNFGTLQLVERRPDGLLSCFPDHRREDVALAI